MWAKWDCLGLDPSGVQQCLGGRLLFHFHSDQPLHLLPSHLPEHVVVDQVSLSHPVSHG